LGFERILGAVPLGRMRLPNLLGAYAWKAAKIDTGAPKAITIIVASVSDALLEVLEVYFQV